MISWSHYFVLCCKKINTNKIRAKVIVFKVKIQAVGFKNHDWKSFLARRPILDYAYLLLISACSLYNSLNGFEMGMIIYSKVTLFLSHCFAISHTGSLLQSKKSYKQAGRIGNNIEFAKLRVFNCWIFSLFALFFKSKPNLTSLFSISQSVEKCNCKTEQ